MTSNHCSDLTGIEYCNAPVLTSLQVGSVKSNDPSLVYKLETKKISYLNIGCLVPETESNKFKRRYRNASIVKRTSHYY